MVGSGGLAAPPQRRGPLTATGITALSAGKERTGAEYITLLDAAGFNPGHGAEARRRPARDHPDT
jgi:hypothetical protein